MESYHPSGRSGPGALIVLCLCVVVAGGIAGAIVHGVSMWYRILMLYSLAIGVAVGRTAVFLIERRHVRAPVAAALLAFIGGAIGWGTDMGIGYLRARSHLAGRMAPLIKRAGPIDQSATGRAVSFVLVKWSRGEAVTDGQVLAVLTGRPMPLSGTAVIDVPQAPSLFAAAIGYMRLRAAAGTKIVYDEDNVAWQFAIAWTVNKTTGRESIEYPELEGVAGKNRTLILWLLDISFAGGLAAWMAFDAAKEPFCEACGTWYGSVPVLLTVGTLSEERAIKNELDRLDMDSLCRRMAGPEAKTSCVTMLCRYCQGCMKAPVFTELVAVKEGRRRTIASGLLSSGALLRLALAARKE